MGTSLLQGEKDQECTKNLKTTRRNSPAYRLDGLAPKSCHTLHQLPDPLQRHHTRSSALHLLPNLSLPLPFPLLFTKSYITNIPHKTTETEIETETETQNRRLFKSERNGAFPSDCVNKGGRKPTRVSDIVVRAVELVFRL